MTNIYPLSRTMLYIKFENIFTLRSKYFMYVLTNTLLKSQPTLHTQKQGACLLKKNTTAEERANSNAIHLTRPKNKFATEIFSSFSN